MYEKGVRRAKEMRIIALLLAVILFIPLSPGVPVSAAAAETLTVPDSAFTIEEKVIEGTSETCKVITEISKDYINDAQYKKLVIPSGISKIADAVFAGMVNLEEVIIPDGVTSIGYRSFYMCSALKKITIPASVDIIGIEAFAECNLSEGVIILGRAEGTTKVCDGAFDSSTLTDFYASHSVVMETDAGLDYYASSSSKVNIYANGNSGIGQYAAGDTTNFALQKLPDNSEAAYTYEVIEGDTEDTVKITGYYSDVQTPVIPDTINGKKVTTIGETAFTSEVEGRKEDADKKITSVTIGEDVETIEVGAFDGLKNDSTEDRTNKVDIKVVEGNEHLSDWVLDNQNGYDVIDVPNNLQKIEKAAQVINPAEGSTDNPAEILHTSVGMNFAPYVFEASTADKTVTTTIQTVPKLADTGNSPKYLFQYWKLTAKDSTNADVDISDAYIDDVKLPETELTIPPVKYTDVLLTAYYIEVPEANAEDSLIRKYDQGSDQHYICAYNGVVVDGNSIKPDLVINDSYNVDVSGETLSKLVTQIGYNGNYNGVDYDGVVFRDRGLKSIQFGAGVSNVLPNAFDEAYGLQKIEVRGRHDPTGNVTVGTYYSRSVDGKEGTGVLFKKTAEGSELVAYPLGLENTSYEIPDDVTSIGERAFKGCTNIKSVTLNTNLKSIGKEAFKGCVNLGTVHMGAAVESIGDSAFEGCGNLTNVTWGGNEKTIGSNAFNGTLLTVFELPVTVESIGSGAFANCTHLEKITIRSRTVEFGAGAFARENASAKPPITLAGYINSTTQKYVTDNGALENVVFEAIPGSDEKQQVVVDSNAADWLWISTEGGSHKNELVVPAGTESEPVMITVGVRKLEEPLENGTRLLDKIKITSETPSTGGEALSIDMPVKLMIINNQKAGLTLDDITYKFPMPSAHVTISIPDDGWEIENYDPLPGMINAEPVEPVPEPTEPVPLP